MKRREQKRMVINCPYRNQIFCSQKKAYAYDNKKCIRAINGYFETCPIYTSIADTPQEVNHE